MEIVAFPATPVSNPPTVTEKFKVALSYYANHRQIPIQDLLNSKFSPSAEKHILADRPELLSALKSLNQSIETFNRDVDDFETSLRSRLEATFRRVMPDKVEFIEMDGLLRAMGGYCAFAAAVYAKRFSWEGTRNDLDTEDLNFRSTVSADGICHLGGNVVASEFAEPNGNVLEGAVKDVLHEQETCDKIEQFVLGRRALETEALSIRNMADELFFRILDDRYTTVVKGCCP